MTSLPRWLSGLFSAKSMSSRQARRQAPRRPHRTLLRVEHLEDRLAPAVITVTNLKSGVVVYAYAADKGSAIRGKQSVAESCAKHLKERIEKGK